MTNWKKEGRKFINRHLERDLEAQQKHWKETEDEFKFYFTLDGDGQKEFAKLLEENEDMCDFIDVFTDVIKGHYEPPVNPHGSGYGEPASGQAPHVDVTVTIDKEELPVESPEVGLNTFFDRLEWTLKRQKGDLEQKLNMLEKSRIKEYIKDEFGLVPGDVIT